jgi:hypothetical protein
MGSSLDMVRAFSLIEFFGYLRKVLEKKLFFTFLFSKKSFEKNIFFILFFVREISYENSIGIYKSNQKTSFK